MNLLTRLLFWGSIIIGAIGVVLPEESIWSKLFLTIFFIGLGLCICIGALIYTLETHKKQNYAKNFQIGERGYLEQKIAFFIGKIFDLTPWWIIKIVYFLLGLVFIAFGIFLLTLF